MRSPRFTVRSQAAATLTDGHDKEEMPVKRLTRLLVVLTLAGAVAAPLAAGGERMWIGFHDDPSFRWEGDRSVTLDRARQANATMVRAVVTWASVAPTRPAQATNPFDPAYQLNDVDELVRETQKRGMEVLLTIWGTPKWANGNKTPNVLPRKMADLTNFARALASRYSGRFAGYPFVRFWSVWNESNLQLFLTPQFNAKGKIIGPALYARLYAAAYKGIKAGNPRALVGMGETSSHGRDKKVKGQSDTVRPGTFARLVAQANPRLKFDAYTHHPYPTPVNMKPTQRVLWPNVSLASLPRFEKSLDLWFKRRNIPIWITEYGHETRPGEPKGVSPAQQAVYVRQAMNILRKDQRVGMFIWFIWQDSLSSLWQSGMLTLANAQKPALPVFTNTAKPLDARNPMLTAKGGGTRTVSVKLTVREFCTGNQAGTPIGTTYRVRRGSTLVAVAQPQLTLAADCSVTALVPFTVAKKARYTITFDLNEKDGVAIQRIATVVGV
jgi:Cellulase (glycosyl hydrolase family 5)